MENIENNKTENVKSSSSSLDCLVIKPCPFCGGASHIKTTIEGLSLEAIVVCNKCKSSGCAGLSTEQAIEFWNTRAL